MLTVDAGAVQLIGKAAGAPASPLGMADERPDGVGMGPDRHPGMPLRVKVLKVGIEFPQLQIRHAPRYGAGDFNVANLGFLDSLGPGRVGYTIGQLVILTRPVIAKAFEASTATR